MKGTKPGRLPRPSRATEGDERVCSEGDCSTKLSRYNARERCWQHSDVVYPHYRGRRLASDSP